MDPSNGSDSLFNFCNYFQSQIQFQDQEKMIRSSSGKNLNPIGGGPLSTKENTTAMNHPNNNNMNGFSPFILSSSSPSSSSQSSPPSTSIKQRFNERNNDDCQIQTLNKNLQSLLNDDILSVRPKNIIDPIIISSSSTTSSSTDKSSNSFSSESNEYDNNNLTNQDSLLLNLNDFITASISNSNNSKNNNQKCSIINHQQSPQQFRDNNNLLQQQSSAFIISNSQKQNNLQQQQQQPSLAFPSSSNSSSPPLSSQTSGPSSTPSETTAVVNTNVNYNNNQNIAGNTNCMNFFESQNLSPSMILSSMNNNNTNNNNNNTNNTSLLLSKVINNPFNNNNNHHQISPRKNENLFLLNVNPLDNAFSLMITNSLLNNQNNNKNSVINNIDKMTTTVPPTSSQSTSTTTLQKDLSSLFSTANDDITLESSLDLGIEQSKMNNSHSFRSIPTTSMLINTNRNNIQSDSLLLNNNNSNDPLLGNNHHYNNNQSNNSKLSPLSFNKNNVNSISKNNNNNASSQIENIKNNNNKNNSFTINQLATLNDILEHQHLTSSSQQKLSMNTTNNNDNVTNGNNLTVTTKTLTNTNLSMLTRFDHQIQSLANEINSNVQLYINSIQMRKEQLLKQLEHVRNAYSLLINQQMNANHTDSRTTTISQLPKITFTQPDQNLFKSITSFGFINTPAFAPYCQISGEGISIAIEGEPTCFSISAKNCFNEDILIGGENIDIEIQSNEIITNQNKSFLPNSSFQIQKNILDNNNGKYNVTYTIPRGSGIRSAKIFISINGLLTNNSPYIVTVKSERLRENWKLLTLFGEEGTEPGKFCRPWGIAIARLPLQKDSNHKLLGDVNTPDIPIQSKSFYQWQCPNHRKDYILAVADRSNNRIQVLALSVPENISNQNDNSTGQFIMTNKVEISVLHVFGKGPGTRPGLFDRPAGIAINSNLGQLIVADKDNHRIQVFDLFGGFIFKFGEKGSRPGQFCYPWDVAICPQTSMILVSDTRNRRIQLFSHHGHYLWHCGQPLDSPRGVAFLTPDRYIISDFNKHRLLIIDRNDSNSHQMMNHRDDFITSKYIGFGEGSAWGEFLRPQGLVALIKKNSMINKYVQIICADSRNNRIAIYNSLNQKFEYINSDLMNSSNSAAFDRPSGIAIADNILAIIDFGNNRLQIFVNNLG